MSHRAVRVATVIVVAFVALVPAKLPAASSCEWNNVERVVAIYEVGWSGFWLARWLARHGVETLWPVGLMSWR